jgi:hypothetical protein
MSAPRPPDEAGRSGDPRLGAPPWALALALACAAVGWLELAFACADGDLLPGAVCDDGRLTPGTYVALLLAAFLPTVIRGAPVRWRATAIVVLCVLVPFCLGYLHIGA